MDNLECIIDIFVMSHRDIIIGISKAVLYIVTYIF